jgi:vacuolar-type H+-ATPase subunit B/Vma2
VSASPDAISDWPRDLSGDEKNLEQSFVNQVGGRRSIEETLEVAWKLLLTLPEADLKRIDPALVARYGQKRRHDE